MKRQMTVLSLAVFMCLVLTACGSYDSSTPEYTGVSSGRDSYFAPAAGSSSFGSSDVDSSADSSYVNGQIANVADDVSQMQDAQEQYGEALNEALEDIGNFEGETDSEGNDPDSVGSDNAGSEDGGTDSEDETESESETGTDDESGSSGGSSGSGGSGSGSGSSGSSEDESEAGTESESDAESESDTENMTEETAEPLNASETDSDTEEKGERESENESESESESGGISMAELLFPETIEDETEDLSSKENAEDESELSDEAELSGDESAGLFELSDGLTEEEMTSETASISDIESMTEETEETENKFSISFAWNGFGDEADNELEDETDEPAEALNGISAMESDAFEDPIADALDEAMEGMESVLTDSEIENGSDREETEDAESTVLELLTDDGSVAAEDLFSEFVPEPDEDTATDAAEDSAAAETDAETASNDDVLYNLQQYLTQELNVMADSLWGDGSSAADGNESMGNTFLKEGDAGDVMADAEEPEESFGGDANEMQDSFALDIQQPDDLTTDSDMSDDLTRYEEILSLSDEFTPYLDDFQAQLEQMQQDIGLDADLSSGLDMSGADILLNSLDSLDISSTGSLGLSSDMESYLETFQSEIGSSFDSSLDISGLDTDSMFNMFMISSIVDEIQSYSMDSDLSSAIDASSFDSLFSGFSDSLLGN